MRRAHNDRSEGRLPRGAPLTYAPLAFTRAARDQERNATYYVGENNETTWEVPEAAAWEEVIDQARAPASVPCTARTAAAGPTARRACPLSPPTDRLTRSRVACSGYHASILP